MHDIRALPVSGDLGVAEVSERQEGLIASWQLAALGLGRGAIAHRARNGRLHRIHRGVYAVGRRSVTGNGRLLGAVLACGEGAVVSHRSAAKVWGLRRPSPAAIDVTAVGRADHAGLVVHRVRRLHADDVALRHEIPVTAVPRTLLDLATLLLTKRLRDAIEAAERLRLFDLRAIEAMLRRSNGHPGVKPLREALADVHGAPPITRSELEVLFLDFCREHGLPLPATNVIVCSYEVDAAWVARRLVVELDGFEFHGTRAAFERDRERDARLQLNGFRVLRVTHRRITRDAAGLDADIRSFLAL